MFENIFHPSDFTQTSQVAFCHALKIALAVNAELKMLHVDGLCGQVHVKQGDIVQSILTTSRELEADLIAMTTDGHHGFLDAVRGNTTEQVLWQAECPLWAVTKR